MYALNRQGLRKNIVTFRDLEMERGMSALGKIGGFGTQSLRKSHYGVDFDIRTVDVSELLNVTDGDIHQNCFK